MENGKHETGLEDKTGQNASLERTGRNFFNGFWDGVCDEFHLLTILTGKKPSSETARGVKRALSSRCNFEFDRYGYGYKIGSISAYAPFMAVGSGIGAGIGIIYLIK